MKRLFSSWFWKYNVWYPLCAWFNPRQKWLTKHVKNTWQDKPELIRDILFASLIHYVEEENGIVDPEIYEIDYQAGYISQEYMESVTETNTALREVYDYLTTERPVLAVEEEEALNGESPSVWIAKQAILADKDVWAMTTIAQYSPYMWT